MREVGGSNPPPPILKKILILSANYGTGHLIAAKAIKQLLEEENEVEIIDIVEEGYFLEKISSKAYIWLNRHSHLLWRFIYYNPISKSKILRVLSKKLIRDNIYKKIKSYKPDIIISTHFYATVYGIKYKAEYPKTKLFVCITDYEVHPFWIYNEVDLYFLPSHFSLQNFKLTNYVITGIPLRRNFWQELNKYEIRKKLKIETNNLVVLLNLGSHSVLPLKDAIKYINLFKDKLYFLIIGGKDKVRYEKIQNALNQIGAYYKLYSFTEDIHELMFACDFSITKAGGLSLSELIYTKRPAIYYKSLPGQEEGNEKFIREYGLGFTAKNFSQLLKFTNLIIENPSILDYFQSNLSFQKENMNFFRIRQIVSHETYAL